MIDIPKTEDVFEVVKKAIEEAKNNLLANPCYLADFEATEIRSIFASTPSAKRLNRL